MNFPWFFARASTELNGLFRSGLVIEFVGKFQIAPDRKLSLKLIEFSENKQISLKLIDFSENK